MSDLIEVAVVTKNTDFTEGRGPNVFHKVFRNSFEAQAYVMSQPGIMGSEQPKVPQKYGNTLCYNGYEIKIVPLE